MPTESAFCHTFPTRLWKKIDIEYTKILPATPQIYTHIINNSC